MCTCYYHLFRLLFDWNTSPLTPKSPQEKYKSLVWMNTEKTIDRENRINQCDIPQTLLERSSCEPNTDTLYENGRYGDRDIFAVHQPHDRFQLNNKLNVPTCNSSRESPCSPWKYTKDSRFHLVFDPLIIVRLPYRTFSSIRALSFWRKKVL